MDSLAAIQTVMPLFILMLGALGVVSYKSLSDGYKELKRDQQELFTLKVVFSEVRLRTDERITALEDGREEFTRIELDTLRKLVSEQIKEISALKERALLLAVETAKK